MFDLIFVGGGPVGLSAALMLGRCRRRVLICDLGQPRNRRSRSLHGDLIRDGIAPPELNELGRRELAAYDIDFRCTGLRPRTANSIISASRSEPAPKNSRAIS